MQATQPIATYQVKAGIAAFVAAAILVAAFIAASVVPSLRVGSGAGTNAGSAPLQLDADAGRNPGQRGLHANVPS